MAYWLVFGSKKISRAPGSTELADWTPIGVYESDASDEACKAAAQREGTMGTYFAIEGSPWGITMLQPEGVKALGQEMGPNPQAVRIRELERLLLERGEDG